MLKNIENFAKSFKDVEEVKKGYKKRTKSKIKT